MNTIHFLKEIFNDKNFKKLKEKYNFQILKIFKKKYCNGDVNWNIRKVEIWNTGYTCDWLEEKKNLRVR